MFDFVLTVGDRSSRQSAPDLAEFAAYKPERVLRFAVEAKPKISVTAFWWESHPVHRMSDRMRVDDKGISLLAGYPLDNNMKPIRTVAEFDPKQADTYEGDYFFLRVDEAGACHVHKSVVCSYQLYTAQKGSLNVLASRAMLAAVAATGNTKPQPELGFARWICTYGGAGNTDALFEGVRNILWNETISVQDGKILLGKPDYGFLTDHGMQESYARSPTKYWDEVYDYLVASMSVLEFSDMPIEFPLSGGKDSRLLLGLMVAGNERDRLKRVFTNGPEISPEVRSAKLVCEALGLTHEFVDHTSITGSRQFRMDDKILRHVHTTEGEMSPHDPTYGGRPANVIQMVGVESGLRNVAGVRDVSTRDKLSNWYSIHLSRGDRCKIYKSGMAEQNLDEAQAYIDTALDAGVPADQVPTLYRMVPRSSRWVSRTWRANNDRFFSPYIFANIRLLRAAFNCGSAARGREEFHFEMLRRISPELIEIPFAGQAWAPELASQNDLVAAEPLHWPQGTKPQTTKVTSDALYRSFDDVKTFLLAHEGPALDRLLDKNKLANFNIEGTHPSDLMSLWNVIQIAAIELSPDLQTLTSGALGPDIGLPSFDF